MTDDDSTMQSVRPTDPVGRFLLATTRGLAILSGLILVAMTVMEVVSVTIRSVLGAPIPGDFELVQIGTAVAVFGVLPYCHMLKSNFIVDFVLAKAPAGVRFGFDALGGLILAVIAGVLTWRMYLGGVELREAGETTLVLGIGVWTAFPAIVVALVLLTAVSVYHFLSDLGAVRR
jgi:TRAP-type C4-dicarboxylate transport system permease small subunit